LHAIFFFAPDAQVRDRMPQPASHWLSQALLGEAAVIQLLTVWLTARMQHGQVGKLFGCRGARVVLARLLSSLM